MNIDNLIFLSGAEMADQSIFVVCQDSNLDISEYPHSLFRHRSTTGEWTSKGHGPWISKGISKSKTGNGIISLGPDGDFLELQIDANHTRNNVLPENSETAVVFRFIKLIDGIIYAGGTNNRLYHFTNAEWVEIGIDAMRDVPRPRSFENAMGFNAKELYTFGWKGAIWTNALGEWQKIPSPTDYILNDGDILNEYAYIAGQLGTILKGRNDQWEIIENNISDADIWSVCSFENAIYFATGKGILRLKEDELTLFKSLGPDMRSTMNLFVGPSGLYSVGSSDIVLFDGEQWHTIEQN